MIHRALKLTREFHRIKQTDLADRLDISKSFLSEIESGIKSPTLELLGRYSQVFEIPVSAFLMFSERLENKTAIKKHKQVDRILKFLEWVAGEEGGKDVKN
ncbi:MAG: helix-turn-helix domain-containing protein [Bryobacterales bacterium]|nr:helix-turn-helix domain-containing protein [Bryobacterales bacterium]